MSKSYQHLTRDERAAIAIGFEQGLSRRAKPGGLIGRRAQSAAKCGGTAANACIIRRGPGSVVKPGGFGRNAG